MLANSLFAFLDVKENKPHKHIDLYMYLLLLFFFVYTHVYIILESAPSYKHKSPEKNSYFHRRKMLLWKQSHPPNQRERGPLSYRYSVLAFRVGFGFSFPSVDCIKVWLLILQYLFFERVMTAMQWMVEIEPCCSWAAVQSSHKSYTVIF